VEVAQRRANEAKRHDLSSQEALIAFATSKRKS